MLIFRAEDPQGYGVQQEAFFVCVCCRFAAEALEGKCRRLNIWN